MRVSKPARDVQHTAQLGLSGRPVLHISTSAHRSLYDRLTGDPLCAGKHAQCRVRNSRLKACDKQGRDHRQAKLKKAVQRGKALQAERDALHAQLAAAAAECDGAAARAAATEAAVTAADDAAEELSASCKAADARSAELEARLTELKRALQAAEAERNELRQRVLALSEASGTASAQVPPAPIKSPQSARCQCPVTPRRCTRWTVFKPVLVLISRAEVAPRPPCLRMVKCPAPFQKIPLGMHGEVSRAPRRVGAGR
jgi:Tfp pilus assembly protein FimV